METLQRTANRGSVSTGYDISNSVKLEADNNEWFYNASPTAGNRRTYTYSFWIKRIGLGTVNASGNQYVMGAGQHGRMFFGSDYFQYRFDDGHVCRNMTRKFRDTNAWYHFVVAVDTTQATASNRVKFYVNGDTLEVDDHDGGSFPDQNDQGAFFSTNYYTLGTGAFGGSYNAGDGGYDMRAYLAEVVAIDGQQLSPTDFGEYDDNGVWIPKDVSGLTFGSEGFYLTFETASDMGDDKSGNGNDLTENNLTSADQATDTPTNNFNIFTELHAYGANYAAAITEGGTKIAFTPANWAGAKGSFGLIRGKWYWEFTLMGNLSNGTFGIQTTNTAATIYNHHAIQNNNTIFIGYPALSYYYWTGGSQTSDESTGWASGFTPGSGDVFGFALDLDNSTKRFFIYRNGTLLNGASGTNLPSPFQNEYVSPFVGGYQADGQRWNFGGYTSASISSAASDANGYGVFEYAPPTGFYSLCTKNLAEYG